MEGDGDERRGSRRFPLRAAGFTDVRLGRLVGYLGAGRAIVDVYLDRGPLMARCLATMTDDHLFDAVARSAGVTVAFENGDLNRAVVIELGDSVPGDLGSATASPALVPGVRHEWVLRWGKTSLTLRADGTILIQGTKVEIRGPQADRVDPKRPRELATGPRNDLREADWLPPSRASRQARSTPDSDRPYDRILQIAFALRGSGSPQQGGPPVVEEDVRARRCRCGTTECRSSRRRRCGCRMPRQLPQQTLPSEVVPQVSPRQQSPPWHGRVAGRQQPPLMHSSSPQQSVPFARRAAAPKAPQQTLPTELVLQVSPLQHVEAAVHGRGRGQAAAMPVRPDGCRAPSVVRLASVVLGVRGTLGSVAVLASSAAVGRGVAAAGAVHGPVAGHRQMAPPSGPAAVAGPMTSGTAGETRPSSTSTVAVP